MDLWVLTGNLNTGKLIAVKEEEVRVDLIVFSEKNTPDFSINWLQGRSVPARTIYAIYSGQVALAFYFNFCNLDVASLKLFLFIFVGRRSGIDNLRHLLWPSGISILL